MLYDGDGRKTLKYTKDETKEKIPHLVALPSPINEVEADCFLVSENTENKPDLPYLPTPPLRQDMTQGQFLSGV